MRKTAFANRIVPLRDGDVTGIGGMLGQAAPSVSRQDDVPRLLDFTEGKKMVGNIG